MRLVYAYFANSAGHLTDGRLCVFGADFDGVSVVQFPALLPPFCLVAKFELAPSEALEGHTFRLEMTKPNGERQAISENSCLNTSRNPRRPELPAYAHLILTLTLGLDEGGDYLIHVVADNADAASLPFYVTQTQEQNHGQQ